MSNLETETQLEYYYEQFRDVKEALLREKTPASEIIKASGFIFCSFFNASVITLIW